MLCDALINRRHRFLHLDQGSGGIQKDNGRQRVHGIEIRFSLEAMIFVSQHGGRALCPTAPDTRRTILKASHFAASSASTTALWGQSALPAPRKTNTS
jgi:hypothetical protein